MSTLTAIAVPDVLLVRGEGDEWIFCPVTKEARDWLEAWTDYEPSGEGGITVRGFSYVVELFDSLTDEGLSVR